ncbi:hypothetical protein BGX21_008146 [Mortierella sp. AD011]|nr:hypothetical protein BGX20_010431 [Mortierella sp. AD010]KAF9398124.1 hypothetical protein BGX21_008146 [Mortierella sp. AD011]
MAKEQVVDTYQDYVNDKIQVEDEEGHYELDEEDESPIEEVRITVPNTDDPTIPCNTFRMWFLGIFWTLVIAFVNMFFYLRQTGITLGYSVVALLSLPMGHFMARVLPTRQFNLFGWRFTLNPGPFSLKEHVLIGTMISCTGATAYAVDIVILQKVFYNDHKPFIAGYLLVLTTQMTGFAFAGALRQFLIRPAHMVWPANLVYVSLFRSLHHTTERPEDQGRMSRMRYFYYVTLGSFLWYWFPNYIFPTVGVLSWICWIKPDNVVLAQITGSNGLGFGTIALDWAAVTLYVQALITPWFAQVNILVGLVVVVYIMVPWAYYTDLWNSKNYPILSADLYTRDGGYYNISEVLVNNILSPEKYVNYGVMRMDSFFALTYGVGFAGLTATITHVLLYNGKEMVQNWKSSRLGDEDIHTRLMSVYKEVPDWWYGLLFVITLALSFVTCVVYDYMPWWALILALAIAAVFVLPVGIVQAVTNQQPGLNVVTEYIIGYLLPGHAIANVTFKTYGYIVNTQALAFTQDLKLGHYMKIPPRIMFMAQVLATFLASTVNLVTAIWLVNTRPNICTEDGYPFTCRSTQTFYSASVIWGAIGPARVFGNKDGAIYSPVQWGFLIGALLPIPFWYATKLYPNIQWLKLVHWPVLLAATSNIPPGLPYFFTNGLFLGFVFMYILRRYRYRWWSRYNYLSSAAMDTGVAIGGILIFFIFQNNNINFPSWWGNPPYSDGTTIEEMNAAALDHCALASANYYGVFPQY